MPRRYFTMHDLTSRFHRTSKTIYAWMKREDHPFPLPKIKSRGPGNLWLESEIEEWEDGC